MTDKQQEMIAIKCIIVFTMGLYVFYVWVALKHNWDLIPALCISVFGTVGTMCLLGVATLGIAYLFQPLPKPHKKRSKKS